jgi:hypothetical protein
MRVAKVLILALAALLMLSAVAYAADQLQTQDRLRGEDCVPSTTCTTCVCPNPDCPNADCPGCDGPCASTDEAAVLSSADVGGEGSQAQIKMMNQARGATQMKLQQQTRLQLRDQSRDCEECDGAQTQTRARTQSKTQAMTQTRTQAQTASEECTQAQAQTQTQTQEQEQTQEQTQTGAGDGSSGFRGGN